MKLMKKTLAYMMVIGTFILGSQQTFAAVYGEVKNSSAIAYCSAQGITSSLQPKEQFQILDLAEGKDVYTIDKDGMPFFLSKDAVHVRKVIEVIEMEGVKVRKDPDPDSEIIQMLEVGTQVSAMYRTTNGNWYQVILSDGREGFIYHSQLTDEALKLLPEKDFAKPKVEVLQWSEASKVLPRGGVATIEDVYTGKTFKIKRTFGTNHADVETLTKEDTAKMKAIWGGFSWERRPVIVHVNGRRLAASLAGMPHAGDSLDGVPGNGMSGVIDLHFRGSRKHKEGSITATPDQLHQNAITIAAQYR